MKKILYLFVAITTFACNTTTKKEEKKNDVAVQDTSLSFNLENSNIKWTGTELTSKIHYGSLKLTQANLVIVDSKITSGEFTVDMTSLNVEDLEGEWKERLEGHLSSDDFFSIEKFQTASLKVLNSNSLEMEVLTLMVSSQSKTLLTQLNLLSLKMMITITMQI